jgi:hypothetical protein
MPTDNLQTQNTASVIKHFMLRSDSTGQGLTGKVHSDFSGKYNIAGGTETSLSFSSGSAGDAYSSGKIVPLGLGKYAWHVPDALFAALGSVSAVLSVTGAIDVHFDWLVVTPNRAAAAFGANTTAPATPTNVTDARDVITARLPAALNGGRMASHVEVVSNDAITAAAIAANAITDTKIATGALTDAKFAAGAFDAVWTVATRSLTTFGTLVSDIWSAATRTLTAFSFSPVPSNAADVTAIKAVTDKLDTGLVQDGSVWQFTVNMLELGPSGGDGGATAQQVWEYATRGLTEAAELDSADLREALGMDAADLDDQLDAILAASGGGGDATEAKQDLILDQLQAALTASSAVVPETVGIIEGFPASLRIGDSYVASLNNFIKVYLRDSLNTPLTGIGSKNFTDSDFVADLTISQGARSSLVTATCTWVPAAGPVEGYLRVEIPNDQSRRATEGTATMQLVLKWDGGLEITSATQAVEWMQRVTRSLQ